MGHYRDLLVSNVANVVGTVGLTDVALSTGQYSEDKGKCSCSSAPPEKDIRQGGAHNEFDHVSLPLLFDMLWQ